MKKLLIPILLLSLAGCATMDPAAKITADLTAVPQIEATDTTPTQTPLADVLDRIANNPLLSAVNNDADATIVWVNQAGLDPLATFQALACPTAIKLATSSIQQEVAQAKGLLADISGRVSELEAGASPRLILTLTKLRYGPKGTPGSDPAAMLADLKTTMYGQISAVVDSCRQIFPAKQVDVLLKQAAGLVK